jgi:hypothetical protein
MEVARDWLEAGDADALLVIGAEATGETVRRVFRALALEPPPQGALALLLVAAPPAGAPNWLGVALTPELLDRAFALPPGKDAEMAGQAGLERLCQQAGLPGSGAFGTVRAPE